MNNERIAKLMANKYAQTPGQWCRIHYAASLASSLSDHKLHIAVITGKL